MFLTVAQLVELTGKERPSAQARVLESMGIPFRKRPDGSIVVITTDLHTAPIGRERGPTLRFGG